MTDVAALVVTGMGAIVLVAAVVATPGWRAGIGAALDFWLGAGLLRLADADRWSTIAAAGAIVATRRLLVVALRARQGATLSG